MPAPTHFKKTKFHLSEAPISNFWNKTKILQKGASKKNISFIQYSLKSFVVLRSRKALKLLAGARTWSFGSGSSLRVRLNYYIKSEFILDRIKQVTQNNILSKNHKNSTFSFKGCANRYRYLQSWIRRRLRIWNRNFFKVRVRAGTETNIFGFATLLLPIQKSKTGIT